jgi:hypothetical protein
MVKTCAPRAETERPRITQGETGGRRSEVSGARVPIQFEHDANVPGITQLFRLASQLAAICAAADAGRPDLAGHKVVMSTKEKPLAGLLSCRGKKSAVLLLTALVALAVALLATLATLSALLAALTGLLLLLTWLRIAALLLTGTIFVFPLILILIGLLSSPWNSHPVDTNASRIKTLLCRVSDTSGLRAMGSGSGLKVT